MQIRKIIILGMGLLVNQVQGFGCFSKSKSQVLNNYDTARMRDKDLKMDLLWYCKTGNIYAIKEILRTGVDMNSYDFALEEDQFSETPLMVSVRYNQHATVEYLLNVGANVNCLTSTYRHGPLYWASIYSNSRMVKLLLDHGAKADLCDGIYDRATLLEFTQNSLSRAVNQADIERLQGIIVIAKQHEAWEWRKDWITAVDHVANSATRHTARVASASSVRRLDLD